MNKDVLIIDDEPAIRRLLVGALERNHLSHVEAQNAAEALACAAWTDPPLVALLDLGLPDRDGLEVIPQLTARGISVIVLTARDATDEKVAALDLGADDFVTKPFDSEELLARIRSAIRRRTGMVTDQAVRNFANGSIDRDKHRVILRGCTVELTPREFNLLWVLSEKPGRVMTHLTLLQAVWGAAHKEDLDYLRVAVRALRKKLELDPSEPRLLINEPGIGYRLAG